MVLLVDRYQMGVKGRGSKRVVSKQGCNKEGVRERSAQDRPKLKVKV